MLGVGKTLPRVRLARSQTASRALLQAARATADGSPLFLCDLRIVKHQVSRWRELMPSIEPFYAVKCNNDPEVIRVLAQEGISFDCASAAEMRQVLETAPEVSQDGTRAADRIVYANPVKHVAHVRSARRMGVRLTVFDNASELEKLARIAPGMKLLLRIATDDRKSVCRFSEKFGADEAAVPGLLRTAAALGLDVVGISFHVGSGCYDAATYGDALRRARLAFDAAASMGRPMEVLDIGGGFPGSLHGTITGAGDRERELSREDPGVYVGAAAAAGEHGLGAGSTGGLVGPVGVGSPGSMDGGGGILGHSVASAVSQAAREAALSEMTSGLLGGSDQGQHGDEDEDGLPMSLLQGDPRMGPYAGGDTFREIARALRHYLRRYFPEYQAANGGRWADMLGRDRPRGKKRANSGGSGNNRGSDAMPPMVLAEPGRFFVEASHTLMLTVAGRRDVDALMYREAGVTGRDPRARVYVTDGLYGSLNSVLYDHACVAPAAVPAHALGLKGAHWEFDGPDAALPGTEVAEAVEDQVEYMQQQGGHDDGDSDGDERAPIRSEMDASAKFLMPAVSTEDMAGQGISDRDLEAFQGAAAAAAPVLPLPEDLASEATAAGSAALAAAASVLRPGEGDSDSDSESSGEEGRARVLQRSEEAADATKSALAAALATWASERAGGGGASTDGSSEGGMEANGVPAWYCPSDEWGERQHVSLWGPTCDGFDCIASDILLPSGLSTGDALLFDSAGAYTKAASTAFNGFAMPKTAYISEAEEWDYESSPLLDEEAKQEQGEGEGRR